MVQQKPFIERNTKTSVKQMQTLSTKTESRYTLSLCVEAELGNLDKNFNLNNMYHSL